MKISICIPTLNRPQYLMQAIASIFSQNMHSLTFELCISNNASDADYSEVEVMINKLNKKHANIKYIEQKSRISLDEHMHFVKKMAGGEYIYFLGDDDYFINDAFAEIELLSNQGVELAIFNGNFVDEEGRYLGNHFSLPAKNYDNLNEAFVHLRDKGHFGAVLVKNEILKDEFFSLLYGSSHAYGCYWLYILNNPYRKFKIVIPSKPCVNLRMAQKNYNESKVYYNDIMKELYIYSQNITTDEGRKLNDDFFKKYKKKVFGMKWMVSIFSRGASFSEVFCQNVSVVNYFLFFLKKSIAFFLGRPSIYPVLKVIYKRLKKPQ